MPELPEVETIARSLATRIRGRTITTIEKLDWERMVDMPDIPTFRATIPGRSIVDTGRRAKWLLLGLDSGWSLAMHMRMSGRISVQAHDTEPDKHTHLVLELDSHERIFFRDPRKFGRVRLMDAAGSATLDASLGLEPLGENFTPERLAQILMTHRTRLKPLLLNQTHIAGLGNIYVDESLWHAQIHPLRLSNTITQEEIARLHSAIQMVLNQAIEYGGSTLRDYRDGHGKPGRNQEHFSVYNSKDKPCPRCQTPIVRLVVAQRGTHICPTCQRIDNIVGL